MGKEETTWAAANVLEDWISKYGIPQALYTDWKNVYKRAPTSNELSRGETRCLLSLGGCARSLAHIARFAVSPASPVVIPGIPAPSAAGPKPAKPPSKPASDHPWRRQHESWIKLARLRRAAAM